MKRIKHNDLTHYFMADHKDLPAAYLASCEEFFKWLKDCKETGFKAPSSKPQASSLTDHESGTIKDLERNKLC